jgi:hypothetical protein
MSVTIIVTHCQDQSYLHHFLDIVREVPFLRDAYIWVDGCNSKYDGSNSTIVRKITSHSSPHGVRCFDLLSEADTDKVIIVDSDFFSVDDKLWQTASDSLCEKDMVSITEQWHGLNNFPTTPFVAYNRDAVLKAAPVRDAWKHFSNLWPTMKQPVFDHGKYVYLSLYISGQTFSADSWRPVEKRKFKFFHFWDSRHTPQANFEDFKINAKVDAYLAYGINKFIFQSIKNGVSVLPEEIWDYMSLIKKYDRSPLFVNNTVDFMTNFGYQIRFKENWFELFSTIRDEFIRRFGGVA